MELAESALIKSDQLVLLTRADKDWAYFLKIIYYFFNQPEQIPSLSGGQALIQMADK